MKHGEGTHTYADGSFYAGMYHCNKRQGRGMLKTGDTQGSYDGEWFNDKPHGTGILTSTNQDRFEGEFREGVKHG